MEASGSEMRKTLFHVNDEETRLCLMEAFGEKVEQEGKG